MAFFRNKNFSIIASVLVLFSLVIFLGYEVLRQKSRRAEMKDEYSDLQNRAKTATRLYTTNTKHLDSILERLAPCFPDVLTNSDFIPPIPYFASKKIHAGSSFRLVIPRSNENYVPAFGIPRYGLSKHPITPTLGQGGITIEINADHLTSDLQSYDISFIATQKAQSDACRIDARIYLSSASSSNTGTPTRIFGRIGLEWGRFTLPYGSLVDDARNSVIISDCTNGLIQEVDFHGNLRGIINTDQVPASPPFLLRPADVKLHKGRFYVTEETGHRYSVFDRDGAFLHRFGQHYSVGKDPDALTVDPNPGFNLPLGIALDSSDNIYISDYGNDRIQKLNNSGELLEVWGGPTLYDGRSLRGPYYLEIDENLGRLYVGDRGNNRIVVFNLDGEFLFSFGDSGDSALSFPHEIAVSNDGRIMVADTGNYRIAIFNEDGTAINGIPIGREYGSPKTVAVSKSGFVFVGHVSGRDSFITVWPDPPNVSQATHAQLEHLVDVTSATHARRNTIKDKRFDGSVYKRVCISCHETGALGAPRARVAEDWQKYPKNIEALLSIVRQGKGAMMPSGGCEECTDKELIEAIKTMLPDAGKDYIDD